MLEIRNLSFKHQGEREVLKEISFTANPSEITVILGPNGAGKSTLFKCISGVWRNYRGEIKVSGERVDNLSFDKRARFFAIVPQEHVPPFAYRVFDVVLMGRASYVGLFSLPGKEDYKKAEEILEMVGIKQLKDEPYTEISGGERQLVLIARALVQEAPVLLLDEPTSHLDFKNQQVILAKIKEITIEKKLTTVITLHDPNLASIYSNKIIAIKKGKVFFNGSPDRVIDNKVLEELYEINLEVIKHNGTNFVLPRIKEEGFKK
ncbi:MAG: ABC transporter ATP-binding protein [Caldimicrobium sp.]